MKIRKKEDDLWIADCRIEGKGPQLSFRFKKDAEDALFRYRKRLEAMQVEVEGKTMQDAKKAFLADCRLNGLSSGSIGFYERVLDHHVLKHIEGSVSAVDVEVLQAFRSTPPHTMGAANATLPFGLLLRVLDFAHGNGWIGINPVDELPDIKRRESYNRKARRDVLHMPCRAEWLLCLNRSTGLIHLMMRLAITAGLRIGEIMALRWEDVLLERRCIRIVTTSQTPGTRRKDGDRTKTITSERLVPMDASLHRLLVGLKKAGKPRNSAHVVLDDGKPLTMNRAAHLLHQFLKDNGITRTRTNGRVVGAFGWHSFRHVFAARWIARQVPIAKLMAWIGHKRPSTTIKTYGVLLRDRAAWESAEHRPDRTRPASGEADSAVVGVTVGRKPEQKKEMVR